MWMITEISKAQLLALQVGRLKDQEKAQPAHISMAKRNNVWMALECARLARDILGANGIADEYPCIPSHGESGGGKDLRGNARHSHVDSGSGDHRDGSVLS